MHCIVNVKYVKRSFKTQCKPITTLVMIILNNSHNNNTAKTMFVCLPRLLAAKQYFSFNWNFQSKLMFMCMFLICVCFSLDHSFISLCLFFCWNHLRLKTKLSSNALSLNCHTFIYNQLSIEARVCMCMGFKQRTTVQFRLNHITHTIQFNIIATVRALWID